MTNDAQHQSSTSKGQAPHPATLYDQCNDAVRVDNFNELDDAAAVAMRSFFRKLGAPHLYEERVLPTLKTAESSIFAAVRDRPWPPWGYGSRRIVAMIQVHPVGNNSFGLSPAYVRPEEAANIGMRAALYKEVLESLEQRPDAEINYLVVEGAVMTDHVLTKYGFQPSKDLVQTEDARYFFYRAPVRSVLDNLGLANVSIPELLAHKVEAKILEANALFQGVLDWARLRELITIDGGSFDASLPGGVPPSPPTARIDIGGIDIITNPGAR
ncbi:hypothetical protein [Pseudoduganella sp. HUAS MS19]